MKKIKILSHYAHLDGLDGPIGIVQIWTFSGVPFTFDELPLPVQQMEDVALDADTRERYHIEDLYRWSEYLIDEEAHPLLFDLEYMIENFEELPN